MIDFRKNYLPIALLIAVVWGLSTWGVPPVDADLGWHLLGGRYISSSGLVPRADFINAFNLEWHDYHWLAQLVMWKVFEVGEFRGLQVLLALNMTLLGVSLVILTHKVAGKSFLSLVLLIWSLALVDQISSIRPQVFALLVIVIAQILIISRRSLELVFLFILTALLANIHVYWIIIPALFAIYRAIPRLLGEPSQGAMYVWGGLVILLLAPLISPYGLLQSAQSGLDYFKNYFVLFEYSELPTVIKDTILEFRSTFALENFRVWLVILSVVFFGAGLRFVRRSNFPQLLVFIAVLIAATCSIKYLPLYAILSVPYFGMIVSSNQSLAEGSPPKRVLNVSLLVVILVFVGFYGWRAIAYFPWINDRAELIDVRMPFSACKRLASYSLVSADINRPARILTHFNHGGWCKLGLTLANPGLDWRVTTDNRTQNTPGEHYVLSFDLFNLRDNWLRTLELWSPDAAVVYKRFPLASYMALAPQRWKMIFQDEMFAVFVPLKSQTQQ